MFKFALLYLSKVDVLSNVHFTFRHYKNHLMSKMRLSINLFIFCLCSGFISGQKLFKPFNSLELGKYKLAVSAEKSDLKVNIAASEVRKEDLNRIEGLCVNRTDVDYFRDPDNVKFRCDVVFRCERPGKGFVPTEGVSGIRLVRIQCPSGKCNLPSVLFFIQFCACVVSTVVFELYFSYFRMYFNESIYLFLFRSPFRHRTSDLRLA